MWIEALVMTLTLMVGLGCLFVVALGLPGHWILLTLAVITELADGLWLPEGERFTYGWLALGIVLFLGVIGEIAEFGFGVLGADKGGASRRGQIGAFVGGILGAILGTAIPIPLIGSLLGALGGTFFGAYVGEKSLKGDAKPENKAAAKTALWATVGRVAGVAVKSAVSSVALLVLVLSPLWAGQLLAA
jgi:uncharacterized protein YqgC (DUF456 family)